MWGDVVRLGRVWGGVKGGRGPHRPVRGPAGDYEDAVRWVRLRLCRNEGFRYRVLGRPVNKAAKAEALSWLPPLVNEWPASMLGEVQGAFCRLVSRRESSSVRVACRQGGHGFGHGFSHGHQSTAITLYRNPKPHIPCVHTGFVLLIVS